MLLCKDKPKRQEVNRAKILDAAVQEFGKDGIKGATVDAIAAASGLTKRTLYKYFKNKEAIFEALLSDFLSKVASTIPIEYDANADFDEQLQALVRRYVQAYYDEEHIRRARLISCEFLKGREVSPSQLRQFETWESKLKRWMELAKIDGKLATEFSGAEIADQFISLVKGETFYPLLYGLKDCSKENSSLSEARLIRIFKSFYMTTNS